MQYTHIPHKRWREILTTNPSWYKVMVREYKKTKWKLYFRSKKKIDEFKGELYDLFTELVRSGDILLGNEVGIRDEDRQEIDTIVLHHTHHEPGIDLTKLSAIELVRLYSPYYANPTQKDGYKTIDKAISSGHIRDGKQVFRPYHRMIRHDGQAERLLEDHEIGRHAGNRDTNCRSIAIVIDDDLSNNKPNKKQLEAIVNIITTHYSNIPTCNIVGHMESNPKTECPGSHFLGDNGWKNLLLEML